MSVLGKMMINLKIVALEEIPHKKKFCPPHFSKHITYTTNNFEENGSERESGIPVFVFTKQELVIQIATSRWIQVKFVFKQECLSALCRTCPLLSIFENSLVCHLVLIFETKEHPLLSIFEISLLSMPSGVNI